MGQQHAAEDPAVHGESTEPRDRREVHVPVAGHGHRAGADRQQPHQPGEQERQDSRGEADQQVLPQRQTRGSGGGSHGATLTVTS